MSHSNYNRSSEGGISILGLLGIAFVVLKLMGYITWSWWWVTAPFWGGFAVAATIGLSIFIGFIISECLRKR